MGLLRFAALGFAGFLGFRAWRGSKKGTRAAFAPGQADPDDPAPVRNAGPESMRDGSTEPWTEVDEDSDESVPASDPPGNY